MAASELIMGAEIEYRPWKKIVVHEVLEIAPKDFFEGLIQAVEIQKTGFTPTVYWIDGIAFVHQPLADSEKVTEERMEGTLHFNAVQFTRTSYVPEKRTPFNNREYMVKMTKQDKNPDFVNLVKFLKSRPPLEP
jgi:hypothetical protein